jgi:hypothetical protein
MVGRGFWPPRSPDLTFFLWIFLKKKVYSNNPRSLEKLKHNIERTVANTDPETLCKAAGDTVKTVDVCLRKGYEHSQHLL